MLPPCVLRLALNDLPRGGYTVQVRGFFALIFKELRGAPVGGLPCSVGKIVFGNCL